MAQPQIAFKVESQRLRAIRIDRDCCSELRARGCAEAMLWVLAENPSRFFYEVMGGRRTYERVEKLWGKEVPQIGYRWSDLAKTFAEGGPCAP